MALMKIFQNGKFSLLSTQVNGNFNSIQFNRNFGHLSRLKNWKNKLITYTRHKIETKPRHLVIPLGMSGVFVYYYHLKQDNNNGENKTHGTKEKRWKVKMYRTIPWRTMSRAWGWLVKVQLPPWSNDRILSWYVSKYHVNLSEAEREHLRDYKSLADLFGRKLKPGARIIDDKSYIVSPCDGIVLHFGKVDQSGQLEQVKGISYSLQKFLGNTSENLIVTNKAINTVTETKEFENIQKEKSLFFIVIYLSPGDYHGFHSPVVWEVFTRRHFRGELLSVKPSVANWIPGLFAINERVVYIGKWNHGFFSMTLVGATNVGSIRVYEDTDLNTNTRRKWKQTSMNEKDFENNFKFFKGTPFGEFNLGSTIVLVFDAPDQFQFAVNKEQRIQFGETLI